eukprot:1356882-Prymnesium_polylepis.1
MGAAADAFAKHTHQAPWRVMDAGFALGARPTASGSAGQSTRSNLAARRRSSLPSRSSRAIASCARRACRSFRTSTATLSTLRAGVRGGCGRRWRVYLSREVKQSKQTVAARSWDVAP